MKTLEQMMKEVVDNSKKLLQISTREYMKNPNDKGWQDLYKKSQKHYKESVKSLKTFKP